MISDKDKRLDENFKDVEVIRQTITTMNKQLEDSESSVRKKTKLIQEKENQIS